MCYHLNFIIQAEALMADPRAAAVLDVISDSSGIERSKLTPEVTLDELGMTSLKLIEVLFELESRYDTEISTDGILMAPEVTLGELLQRIIESVGPRLDVAPGPASG